MLTIGLDLDGVICDMVGSFLPEAKRLFGHDISQNDLSDFNIWEVTPITLEQSKQIFENDIFLSKLRQVRDASKHILTLANNAIIHIITARWEDRKPATTKWLHDNGIIYDKLSFVPSSQKAEFAKQNGINMFVEDKYSTALGLAEVCPLVCLMDYPWNQGQLPKNVYRFSGWSHLISHPLVNAVLLITKEMQKKSPLDMLDIFK